MKKRFLLTGFYFDGYHGSMMHIYEIAKYLVSKKYDVSIVAVSISDEIENLIKQSEIKLYDIYNLPLDVCYDYILAYHFPILPFLLCKKLKYKKIILGSLSGLLLPLEAPCFLYKYGIPLIVNSQETKNKILDKYGIDSNIIQIMNNLVPDEFLNCKKNYNKQIKDIAVISNHVPCEIRECVKLFKLQNIKVDIYGADDKHILITPQIVSKYDVIITIGKTVQYCLAGGIPVYNYDYFGGIGYITPENIKEQEYYNFSGRGSNKKLFPEDIVCEILAYYKKTVEETEKLKKMAQSCYLLSKNIDKLICYMDNLNVIKINTELQEDSLYYKYCQFTIKQSFDYFQQIKNINIQKETKKQISFKNIFKYYKYRFLKNILIGKWKIHYQKKYDYINSFLR